jgi:ABC-type transporter Mla subunit MlaD
MTAELNEALEEAVHHCEELSQQVESANDVLDALADRAEDLTATVERETEEARDQMQDLAARLEEGEQALEAAGAEARSRFEGLATEAAHVKDDVAEMLSQVKQALESLGERQDELGEQLQSRTDEASQHVQDVAGPTGDAQEAIAERLARAGEALASFRESLESAREEWSERRASLLGALAGLEERARAQADAYAAEIEELLDNQRTDVLVQHLANDLLIARHNQSIAALGESFERKAPERSAQAQEILSAALAALAQLATQEQTDTGAAATGIQERAARVADLVARIGPALQAAGALG